MSGYAIKPKSPFIISGDIKRTPISETNKRVSEFFNTHSISLSYDKEKNTSSCSFTKK